MRPLVNSRNRFMRGLIKYGLAIYLFWLNFKKICSCVYIHPHYSRFHPSKRFLWQVKANGIVWLETIFIFNQHLPVKVYLKS